MEKNSPVAAGRNTDGLDATVDPKDVVGCAGVAELQNGDIVVQCHGTFAKDPHKTAGRLVDLAARILEKARNRVAISPS